MDDDRGLLRLIERALRREGFMARTADSGKAAMEWLAANDAQLMLLDLKLQDVEGRHLIQQLTQAGHCPPFIIITGQGDERVAVDMMKSGAMDYLVKDADFLQFLPAVVKRAVAQLENQERLTQAEAQRKRLEKELLDISDRERQRVGQDLHDGLCQHLAGIELMSRVLEQKLAAKSTAEAACAAEIAEYVRQAIGQTRLLARGLSPITLESEGLMAGLQELATNTEKMFNISCRFECKTPVRMTNNANAIHLYRIAQEAVSNAIKHGQASSIVIRLSRNKTHTLLRVENNGLDFPAVLPQNKGMGLRIMQYRTGMIAGELSIQKGPHGGASLICSVPRPTGQKGRAASLYPE